VADTPAVYDALIAAGVPHGLRPFGMFALNALRIEKGYRAWKGDLSTDYSMLEAGLDRFVKWDKPAFPGKAALEAEKQRGVAKRFALLTLDAPGACDAPYMSTIWQGDRVVGETTSGAWGYRVDKSVALAMIRPELAVPGAVVEVEIFGERFAATVQGDAPLWDPQNLRLTA
jgi:dimethylglycine dehydrogenase